MDKIFGKEIGFCIQRNLKSTSEFLFCRILKGESSLSPFLVRRIYLNPLKRTIT